MVTKAALQKLVKFPIPPDLFEPTSSPIIVAPMSFSSILLQRNFVTRIIVVGTTPVQIYENTRSEARNILIKNASRAAGTMPVLSGLLTSQVGVSADGNIQSTPLDVGNYLHLHLFLNITANTGVFTFINQVYDPISLGWADSQTILASTPDTGQFYFFIGSLGVGTKYSIRWVCNQAGLIDFTFTYMLKYGMVGSSTGASQAIHIGSGDGITTVSGYDMYENEEKIFQVDGNSQIWAVGDSEVINVKILEM